MGLFQPKGDRPEWRIIYDELLVGAEPGDLITYDMLDEVLDRQFIRNRVPLYRARDELGRERLRWLDAEANKGYRVIHANENIKVAAKHKRKGQRQFGVMVKVGEATNLNELTPEELVRHDKQHMINVTLWRVALYHEARINRIEAILRADGKLKD
jgi:hypothetical protein